ncbi:Vta1 like-domain-containing protein [Halenospora varia]|nr:Vta1 like-domain-containing protein [Halenospora varia]
MAAHIPAKLKAADLTRFIVRASQLETAKPVIAYWCEYWIVNQILSKGLHNGDNETLQYTTNLMDKLEQIKADNATNDTIIDDTAGQAYVEQFALETFQRADRAVQADKVTKQTADTFQAAATFLELVNIWTTPDPETQTKIKYAKWNAVRIVKALKEGKDPNESNPKPEPTPEETLPALDPNDPEAQQFGQQPQALQPFVEDVPDEQDQVDARLARQSSIDKSLHPSAQVSARGSPGPGAPAFDPYPRDGFPYTAVQDDNVSPLEPSPNTRNGSVGGGYFPEVPTFTSEQQDATLATTAPDDILDLGLPEQPSNAPGTHMTPDFESFPPPTISESPSAPQAPSPQDFYAQAPPPVQPPTPQHPPAPQQPTNFPPPNPQPTYRAPPPQQHQPPPPQNYAPPPQHYTPPPQHYAAPSRAPEPPRNQQYNVDDDSVKKAQKHAKFAISALNFEDGATAVKELRLALQTLGAL